MNNQNSSSITSSLNQLKLDNLPKIKLSHTVRAFLLLFSGIWVYGKMS